MPQWTIGAIRVDPVIEFGGPAMQPRETFADCDPDVFERHADVLVPNYFVPALGRLIGGVKSHVIRAGVHNILIDTGCGNDKTRNEPPFNNLQTPYLQRLAAIGLAPEDIDLVVLTHLHVDHVGWNTRLRDGRWVPTFPNATTVFSKIDLDFVVDNAGRGPAGNTYARIYEDSLKPVIDAGGVRLLNEAETLVPGIDIEFAPGHTPGHILLRVRSNDAQGLFIGDILHNPFQIYQPDCNSNYCALPDVARSTRRRVLAEAAATSALLFACHFADGHEVRVRREAGGFALRPG